MDYHVSSNIEQRGILAGMLLGKARRNQNNFFILHQPKNQAYALFKKSLLEQITHKSVSVSKVTTRKGKTLIRLEPKLIPLTRVLVKKLFQGKNKQISSNFLNYLTPPGIAIWFMDLGYQSCKTKENKIHGLEFTLNTCLSKPENEKIIKYFLEVWGFKWGLSKGKRGYRLRMGTKEGKRLVNFLNPYIHPSMLSKIQTSYNTTATT